MFPGPSAGRLALRTARQLPPYRVYRRANWLMTNVPGAGLLRTGPQTAKWAIKAFGRSRAAHDGVPTAYPTPGLAAQVAVDEALLGLLMRPSKFPSTLDYDRVGEELAAAATLFRERGWLSAPELYHRDPTPLTTFDVRGRRWMNERFEHLSWESGYEPHPDEPARERWLSYQPVRTAHAYVMRHRGEDRPWLICFHGFSQGFPAGDFAAFRTKHLFGDLGLNLAFPIMPLHGRRKVADANDLLSFDLLHTVYGVAQAVWDTRRLLGWIRSQTSHPVGAYGVSLGGYTGALVSTLAPLDLILAGIPAVDFPALFRHHAPHRVERTARNRGVLGDNATDVHRVISPLALPSLVPAERRFIYAGLGDRMVPPPQPRMLWEHWERPEISWYPGNHVGFMWSPKVKAFIDEVLVGSGFAPARG